MENNFLQLVLDIVQHDSFKNFSAEEKASAYAKLQDSYNKRIEISYRQGFTAGKFEGTQEAINLINK